MAPHEKKQQETVIPTNVIPGFLYLGSYDTASRSELLKAMGITHILNVSSGHGHAAWSMDLPCMPCMEPCYAHDAAEIMAGPAAPRRLFPHVRHCSRTRSHTIQSQSHLQTSRNALNSLVGHAGTALSACMQPAQAASICSIAQH
jgi:hypothetical protein